MCESELKEVKVEDALLQRPGQRAVISHDFCNYADHRKLAICSIICGLSCLGVKSLMYSVKARETRKRNEDSPATRAKVKKYSEKACKWGVGSIVAWLLLILIFPLLLGLVSFFVTFID